MSNLHVHLLKDDFLHDGEEYQLHVAGVRYALRRHSTDSLGAMGKDESFASHFAENVILPTSRVMHLHVTQRTDVNGSLRDAHGEGISHGLAMSFIHVPAGTSGLRSSGQLRDFDPTQPITADILGSYTPKDVATAIIFHHANLMAQDADVGRSVIEHIHEAPGLSDLEAAIKELGKHGWYTMEPVLTDDDQPYLGSDGSAVLQYVVRREVLDAGERTLMHALNAVHNDPAFQTVVYTGDIDSLRDDSGDDDSGDADAASNLRAGGDVVNFKITADGRHPGLLVSVNSSSADRTVTIDFKNIYIRHLSAFIEFLDDAGNVAEPEGWTSMLDWVDSDSRDRLENATRKFVSLINSPSIFLGAGVLAGEAKVTFPFPTNATQAHVMVGGLGNGGRRNAAIEEMGVALTSTFELGVPAMLLAGAAGYHDDGDAAKKLFRASIAADVLRFFFGEIWSKGHSSAKEIMGRAGIFLANVIVKKSLQAILDYIIEQEAESAAEDAIPFVGWALNAVSIATTAAQLAQTSAEVATSPWIMESHIAVTHTVTVTIAHDPKDFEFPATATHFDVKLEFSKGDVRTQSVQLPGTTVSDPQTVVFTDVPAGGTMKATCYFYSNTDWIAGRAEVAGIKNYTTDGSPVVVNMTLQEQLVPLSADTHYSHKERMTYGGQGFAWAAGAAPTATRTSLNSQIAAGSLSALVGSSLNQTLGRMSYSWQSYSGNVAACGSSQTGNLGYAFRTLGLTSNPNDGLKFSGCYDSAPTLVLNQLFTAPDGSGDNLIIGPVGADGYAVSRFSLGGGAGYDASGVLGVFPIRMDVVRLLPRGVMIGISRGAQKIFHLTLADSPVDIADAPVATLLGGPATSAAATRINPNLLLAPRAMDIGLASAVIILEVDAGAPGTPGVLRAFNRSGIPIQYFHSGADHAVNLRSPGAGVTYLDMGIEQKGYIYVLSYTNNGEVADDYILDIYTPAGDFLSSTSGIAAANFSLDAWRNVYTVNYETLTAPGGDTEPTISQWIPSTPNGNAQ